MDKLTRLLDKIEDDIKSGSILGMLQMGLALKVMEDRLCSIDAENAQRCNKLQHKIFMERVYCKDCKEYASGKCGLDADEYNQYIIYRNPDDFCNYGLRK